MKNRILNNWALKIVAVIVAILSWLAIININDPDITRTITNIPIALKDEQVLISQNKQYELKGSSYATVTITGSRSIVSELEASDFTAIAPISEMSIVNAVPVYIGVNRTSYKNRINIISKTEAIVLDIEEIITKEYPITVKYEGEPSEDYVVDATKLYTEVVEVTAAESTHNLIHKAVVTIDVNDAAETLSDKYSIVLYQANDVPIPTSQIKALSNKKIKASTKILKMKTVPLEVSVVGVPADGYSNISVTSSIEEIKILGKAELIDSINVIVIPPSLLNVDGRIETLYQTIDINDYLPEGTKLQEDQESEIELSAVIEKLTTKVYKLSLVKDIKLTNIPENYAAKFTYDEIISISLRGLEELFEDFEVLSINPEVDLKDAVEGENIVALNVTLPDGIEIINRVEISVTLVDEIAANEPADKKEVE